MDSRFKQIPDRPEELMTEVYLFKDDIVIGKSRMMFGYRLRAGIDGDFCYILDICAGDSKSVYDTLFEWICDIMCKNDDLGLDPFKDIPRFSNIKPYPKDIEFVSKIMELL